jgi:hypothetical protein
MNSFEKKVKLLDFGPVTYNYISESLILAQNERWQRGLGMQVEREAIFGWQTVAQG